MTHHVCSECGAPWRTCKCLILRDSENSAVPVDPTPDSLDSYYDIDDPYNDDNDSFPDDYDPNGYDSDYVDENEDDDEDDDYLVGV